MSRYCSINHYELHPAVTGVSLIADGKKIDDNEPNFKRTYPAITSRIVEKKVLKMKKSIRKLL